jgi:hypothetical protein
LSRNGRGNKGAGPLWREFYGALAMSVPPAKIGRRIKNYEKPECASRACFLRAA